MRDGVINRTKQFTTLISVLALALLYLLFSLTPLLPSNEPILAVATWTEHNVANNFQDVYDAYPADIDGDGDIDIVGASELREEIAWWENDGNQNFTKHIVDETYKAAHGVFVADIDGDGDIDIIGASYYKQVMAGYEYGDEIAWWENDGSQNFIKHSIDDNFVHARSVNATDIDGDGDTDILGAANEDGIYLWENDGNENFTEHIIDADLDGAFCVYATDVDGDSNIDILGAGYSGGGFAWYENDGSHNFIKHTIDSSYNQAAWVFAIDLDGDSDIDVLGATGYSGDEIVWWENDGSQNFTEHIVSVNYNGPHCVYAADLDCDYDIDILGTGSSYGEFTWWENDGNQNFTEHTMGNQNGAYGVYATDMDLDGDMDFLGAAASDAKITWWENLTFAPQGTEMSQIQTEVNQLRGLGSLGGVYRQFISSDDLKQKLIEESVEGIEQIDITQEVLILLDLMEEGQDLYTILLDLYSESILGLYDHEANRIYVISDIEQLGPVEKVTYAHEFTHALQDQHFDLSSIGLDTEDNSDLVMAVTSLIEGDAVLLQWSYYWVYLDDTERQQYDEESAESGNGAYDDIPQFIIQDLSFPYSAGFDFVYTIWQAGGWNAVNNVYDYLPQSTEQIIHPEKYLSYDNPQSVTLPNLEDTLGGTWSQLDSDVLGELYMRLYLEAFIDTDQATTAAEGWDGDRYVYLKDASDNRLLILNSIWDSISDANEFFDAYVDFMEEKSDGTWDLSFNEKGRRWWNSDGVSIYLGQQGTEVLIVIAPDVTITGQVLTEFPQFYAAPQADFSADKAEVTKGQNIQFTNLSSGGIASLNYEWDFDSDGTVDSTAESPNYTYSIPGTYTVALKVTDSANNTDMETKVDYITVSPEKGLHFWIWIVVGVGVVAVVGGVAYLVNMRRMVG